MTATANALDELRQRGAMRVDPLRWHHAQALAARIEGQPAAVRALLQSRFDAVVAALREQIAAPARAQARPPAAAAARAARTPLALLNAHLAAVSSSRADGDELASALRFRRAHAAERLRQQLARAAQGAPQQAGPLNSHLLAVQALQALQALSPSYLRRFVHQLEALQWIEQQPTTAPGARPSAGTGKAAKPAAAGGKPARRRR